MATVDRYDAVVIGSGQGGGPLATALAGAGRKVALIEREHIGGTCVNEGCTPTKTMVASARVAYLARRAADYGVRTGPVTVDLATVRERKRAIVESFRSGSEKSTKATKGLDLLMGEAAFTGPKTLDVAMQDGSRRSLEAELIFINTGDRPAMPKLEGLASVAPLDSTSIMELAEVPEHLVVLGGGYVGLEFGQMFRRFGSEVTIVQRGAQLLDREDADVAEQVADILRQDGITILLKTDAVRAERRGGKLQLRVRSGEREQPLSGSHVLVAAGRTPNTERLNLAAAGVQTDKTGHIVVNERLETNVAGVYALGDVKGGPAFTHISYDDFRILRANLLERDSRTTADRPVPYTIYIDPQLGRIGLTEQEAKAQGKAYRVASMPMNSVARALEVDEARGLMKVLIDPTTKQILGAAILGIEGGEIMSMLEIAMLGKLPYTTLRDAVFAHPTLAEALNNLFTSLDGS